MTRNMLNDRKHRLSIIIPTVGRRFELTRLLGSIKGQNAYPDEVIIVDSGGGDMSDLAAGDFDFNVIYLRSDVASLTVQKNIGIKRVDARSTLVGFLDDDIVMKPDSVEKMLLFWNKADSRIGGCGFNITNTSPNKALKLKSFFNIDSVKKGIVLPSGFNTQFCPVDATFQVQWLCGGATVWRKHILDRHNFDEYFKSYGYYEDVEFSYRVGKEWCLYMVHDAKVEHIHSTAGESFRKHCFLERNIVNGRFHFVRKNPEMTLGHFFVATLTQALIHFGKGVVSCRNKFFGKALGCLRGLCDSAILLAGRRA